MREPNSPNNTRTAPREPPQGLRSILTQIGPGLIIAASIVGSGELIVTTKLGADVGFVLLWFIMGGCVIKVFVQMELGRYAITHGQTTLQALNSLPGPRLGLGWMVYVWLVMYVATFFQLAGIVGSIAEVFRLGGSDLGERTWACVTAVSCAILLAVGRYRLIERVSTSMVAMFTVFTVMAVGALYWTEYAITASDVWAGLKFQLPDDFTVAFAAFGIIGVGASELIYYPYWCLEKGYASAVGPNDGTDEWGRRARGWMRVLSVDAWISMGVYTSATIAFYVLGAAVLHGKSIEVTDQNLIASLSQMYSESFKQVGLWAFLVGAFAVLYSTVFIATASNGRLFADFLRLAGLVDRHDKRRYDSTVRAASVLLPIVYLLLFLYVERPLSLVLYGAIAQALMLPLLCWAALYIHHRRVDPHLKSSLAWTLMLWIASLLMMAAGVFELTTRVRSSFSTPVPIEAESEGKGVRSL